MQESFESIMEKLDLKVKELEKGELSLEQSMKYYEEGISLIKILEDKLKSMESRMEELSADGSTKELKVELSN